MVNIKKLNQANIYIKNKDYKSAEKIYYELLHDYPNNELVMSFWGFFNIELEKFSKAEKILETAYNIKKTAPTISSLAYAKIKLKKYDDAIILYEELLKFDSKNFRIYQSIIKCFAELNMPLFINAYVKKYLSKFPDNINVYSFILSMYLANGYYKKVEEYCTEAIQKFPQEASFWMYAGIIEEALYNNEEVAQQCHFTALDLGEKEAFYHLAVCCMKGGEEEKAEKLFLEALKNNVLVQETECTLGLLYLKQHKFKIGYEYYMKRNYFKGNSSYVKDESVIKNQDEINPDEKLYVYHDQGVGDGIMFSRYLNYLKEKYKDIVFLTIEPVCEIFKRSFSGIEFSLEEKILENKHFLVLSDVPGIFNLDFKNIPNADGYLKTDEDKQAVYKQKYFNNDKYKIGLCWQAGSMAMRDHIHRTINIEFFDSMFKHFKDKNIQFYSFQKEDIFDGINKYPEMIDLSEDMNSFDDTAAMMKNLDLFITVDTSNAHIAGAIGGVDTILLIPYCSDWRWFDNTEKTEWYSSVQIIKQNGRQEWFDEVNKIVEIIDSKM